VAPAEMYTDKLISKINQRRFDDGHNLIGTGIFANEIQVFYQFLRQRTCPPRTEIRVTKKAAPDFTRATPYCPLPDCWAFVDAEYREIREKSKQLS